MLSRFLLATLAFLASGFGLAAQDVEFTVSAPNVVAVGEQFRVMYRLNARPQAFNPPTFDKFSILAGPSTSSSSSIQVVNGQMTQTYEYSYTYILEATQEGTFTFNPATATVSKKEYKTNPISIEVVKGDGGQASAQRQRTANQPQAATEQGGDDLFVTIDFDKQTAYRGQPITATLLIYTRANIAGFEDVKFPSFDGFWSQDIETPNNIQFERVNVDGKIFNAGILKKYLLFPQKTGEIKIDPFELVVLTQQRGGRPQSVFDEFFGTYQTVRRRLVSKAKTLKIKDLPANSPASFYGAVGRFTLEATLDKKEIKTNEAVNLKVKVAGTGNLRLIETPKFQFPASFEVFDPKVSDKISTTPQGASGSKTFEFVAIPRGPGNFDLGNVEFTFFDPTQEKYVTLKSKPLSLAVEADGTENSTGIQMVGFGREDVRFIGQDIRFIKTDNLKLRAGNTILFASTLYYILILTLIAIAAFTYWFIQHRRKLLGNMALVRNRQANRMARKRLKNAQQYLALSKPEKFYEELLKAVWGYISDKLSIPVAKLSSDNAKEALAEKGANTKDIEELLDIVSVCEFARYAPKGEQSQMAGLYERAIALISTLEGVIGR